MVILDNPQLLLGLLAAMAAGALLAYLFCAWRYKAHMQTQLEQGIDAQQQQFAQQRQYLQQQVAEGKQAIGRCETVIAELREQQLASHQSLGQLRQQAASIPGLVQEKQQLLEENRQLQQHSAQLTTQLEAQSARFEQEQIAATEKIELLQGAEKRLQEQFENLANKIFEQKNEKFSQTSQERLDALLTPLKDKLEGFKQQVTQQYVTEGKERASLRTEILSLKELNKQITAEAAALTKALKGDNKQQGNWGEVVLERILKESGLRQGHEFDTQVALKNDAGKLYQPDVVVHLPNDKDVVIDSKVSLSAYERCFNEQQDEALRQQYLKEHVASIKSHIRELGKKDYQDLKGLRTLDYVLMFIPVEAAFLLAVEQAPELVQQALDNNIMLVSPTNLLVALRTINNIWQYEYQNQNAQKIADNAAKLYDKFHGFVSDMEKIGKSIETVQKSYDSAWNKLSDGRGNLIRQTEQFRHLGVQSSKRLDSQLVQQASLDD